MTTLNLLLIALVQGITEFLPISSSGHLILIPALTGYEDQGLLIDVAVHVATLAAILVYFHRDAKALAAGAMGWVGFGTRGRESHWFLWIVIGTIPAGVTGVLFSLFDVTDFLRSPVLVACTLIGYGLLMWVVDRTARQDRSFEDVTLRDAILVGCAQALALIPGTSRSGITMTMARYLGFSRVEAARFSFLLSIPAVTGAGLLVGLDLAQADPSQRMDALIAGAMTFLTALAAMAFLMKWLQRASMTVFVVYRIALGVGLLLWVGLA